MIPPLTPTSQEAPAVRGWPLLGSMPRLQRDPLGFFEEMAGQHGDVVRFKAALETGFLLRHPDALRHVLVDNSRAYSIATGSRMMLGFFLGAGLFVNDSPSWLTQRRLMQPLFHRHAVEQLAQVMVSAAAALAERWEQPGQVGQPVDMVREMMHLTLQVVAQALFSADLTDEATRFSEGITDMVELYGRWLRSAPRALLPAKWIARQPRFRRTLHTLNTIVYALIAQRRLATERPADLLTMLLAARDEETGEQMSDQQIRDEIMTLLFAGHETTATALTWTWYLLWQHPEGRIRLQGELESVLGGRVPTVDDLPRLPYTRTVIQETLRLYPPVWTTFRIALKEDVVTGYRVPPGSRIVLSPYLTHRHPAFWPDPETFNPERFMPDQEAARPRLAYFPFGGGPRQCIGSHFAMTEMHLVVATLAQRYQLNLAPNHPVTPEALLTLRPKYGMQMVVKRLA